MALLQTLPQSTHSGRGMFSHSTALHLLRGSSCTASRTPTAHPPTITPCPLLAANLPGTWPDLLSDGPSAPLRTLALSSNAFVGSLPATWPPVLPRLEVLDLSYNTLTGPLPTDLSALPYLSML